MLNKVFVYLRSCVTYLLLALVALFVGVPLLIVLLCTPRAYLQKNPVIYWLLAALYRGFLYASFLPFRVVNGDTLVHQQPALYVANHQSAADILALGYLQATTPHVWFYWDHFSKTPLFSLFVKRLGLGVTQTDARRDARTLLRAIELMRVERCNMLIFPEGGRFNDGRVHAFQPGFALLARRASAPVIPVYLHNVGKAYPPKSFLIHYYPITLYIGTPMLLQPDETDEAFTARVHEWFDKYDAT